jgi:glycogen(starch) synthase
MSTLFNSNFLVESSWEVCNQLGGIYTVIRSKIPVTVEKWGSNYCLLGPLVGNEADIEFDHIDDTKTPLGQAVARMREMGYEVKYGRWLVTGRPQTVLLNPENAHSRLESIKKRLFQNHNIFLRNDDDLYDSVLQWGDVCFTFLKILQQTLGKKQLISHFHEWMAATTLLDLAAEKSPIKTVFTTHATMLGRVLAMNEDNFYSKLSEFKPASEARKYNIESLHQIESAAAKNASTFTTVSEVTALECERLLNKKPDVITPNGLNIARFAAFHEVQIRHQRYKSKIHEFVMGHFFHSYSFDLDDTLYFFTSGRYEFVNKGFDVTLEALQRLNKRMMKEKIDTTVVMFFITKRDSWTINPSVLQTRALLEEVRKNCESIQDQLGERLFYAAAASENDHKLPPLNDLVDDYLKLRYRRSIQAWKDETWPIIVTHNLVNDIDDPLLNYMRNEQMVNSPLDKVKLVYHPDFITSSSPLFGMDYGQFVRGCHLGIFPSSYEPWGYTPLECIARGVPAVTSDLSGFGRYVKDLERDDDETGIHVINRLNRKREKTIEDLTSYLFQFVKSTRRYRMLQRNKLEDFSEHFDGRNLTVYSAEAYECAVTK